MKIKTLTAEQKDRVVDLAMFKGRRSLMDRAVIELNYLAGLGFGEIARLTIEAVTDEAGNIARELRITGPAANGPRRMVQDGCIPTHPVVGRALDEHIRAERIRSGLLFLKRNGRPYTGRELGVRVRRLYQRAGFVETSTWSGRRSFGARIIAGLASQSASLKDAQGLLGHNAVAATLRYAMPPERVVRLFDFIWEDIEGPADRHSSHEESASASNSPKSIPDDAEPGAQAFPWMALVTLAEAQATERVRRELQQRGAAEMAPHKSER